MDEHLRIGDAEREQAATELGEHYAQGRLTAEEHAERLDRVWSARTQGELGPLFVDLPGRPAPELSRRTSRGPRRSPALLFAVLAVVVLLAAVTHAPWLIALPLVALFVVVRRRPRSRCMR